MVALRSEQQVVLGFFSAAVIWVFLEKVALAAFGKQT